jgi:ectoine hydroxylase-related dioxygenase (phytanoyl-CoA dioxygenase family)
MPDAGFWIDENIFRLDECDRLTESVCGNGTPRSRAGARHLMSQPAVAALACDPRLLRIARQALGDSAVPFRATLFEKSGQSNGLVVWHQDTALPLAERFDDPAWGPWSEKAGIHYAHAPTWALARVVALRVHLDDSHASNGPLRVIPGSHRQGVLSDEQVFELAKMQAAHECVVARGGVLAMRPMVIHSSSKSQTSQPRRVLHLEYADSLDLSPGIRLAVA